MSLSMYDASVPVFLRTLKNLDHVLAKGAAYAREKGLEPDGLLQTRIIFDMFPLVRQVQIATDMAKNGAARLAGVEPLKFEDTETTFDQLHARVARASEYIGGFAPGQFADSATRNVAFKLAGNKVQFDGKTYLLGFVLPNLYFHVTTTYNLLRGSGVPIGKVDFTGQ